MTTANNTGKEKFLLLLIMMLAIMLIAVPSALAANNPGHDTLYVLKIGSSNVIGSINISENLTARFVRVTSKFFGDYLDILANGSASIIVPTTSSIQAASNTLYIDSTGNLYINSKAGTSSIVQIGDPATNAITLNVSGEIKRQGVNVPVVGTCTSPQVMQNITTSGAQCITVASVASATNADTVDSHHVTTSIDNRLVKHSGTGLVDSGVSDASDALAMTIDSSEHVGIGITTPNGTLDVYGGALRVQDTANSIGLLSTGIFIGRGDGSGSAGSQYGMAAGDPMIQIGNTDANGGGPRLLLGVNVASRVTTIMGPDAGTSISFGVKNPGGGAIVDALVVNSTGKVGVGTASPATQLDVIGDIRAYTTGGGSSTGLAIGNHTAASGSSTGTSGVQMNYNPTTYDFTLSNVYWGVSYEPVIIQALNFTVKTGSGSTANALTIQSSGRVGIGTTAPGGTLHVNGNVIIEATTTDHNITNDANNDLLIDAGTGGDVIIRIG